MLRRQTSNTRSIQAAVLRRADGPLQIERLQLEGPPRLLSILLPDNTRFGARSPVIGIQLNVERGFLSGQS